MPENKIPESMLDIWEHIYSLHEDTGDTDFILELPAINNHLTSGYVRFVTSGRRGVDGRPEIATMFDLPWVAGDRAHIRADYSESALSLNLQRIAAWFKQGLVQIPRNWTSRIVGGQDAIEKYESLFREKDHEGV